MAFSLLFTAAQKAEAQLSTPLIAGQNYIAGDVTIFVLDDVVFVAFDVLPAWSVQDLHLAIGMDASAFPLNNSGSPKIGNFPYSFSDAIPFESANGGTAYYFMVPNNWPGASQICVAAHAVVKPLAIPGVKESQTAWGFGNSFGNGWSTYFCGTQEED